MSNFFWNLLGLLGCVTLLTSACQLAATNPGKPPTLPAKTSVEPTATEVEASTQDATPSPPNPLSQKQGEGEGVRGGGF